MTTTPHFFLFSESRDSLRNDRRSGEWRFVLESVDGSEKLEVVEQEPLVAGERLELLAVVRGLEALHQPSRVTLITPSRYVSRGLRHGLQDWRESDWQWERFGQMAPIKNDDLWRRVNGAMEFHQVECRYWRFDPGHHEQADPVLGTDSRNDQQAGPRILGPIRSLVRAWRASRSPLTKETTRRNSPKTAVPRPKGLFTRTSPSDKISQPQARATREHQI